MSYRLALCVLAVLALAACGRPSPAETAPSAAPSLDGSEWILTSLNGRAVLPDSNITLGFKDGQATGTSGCNGYGGQYTAAGGTLSLAEVASTAMLCLEPPGVMEQEEAFLDALRDATVYRLSEDRLEIATALGDKTLTFARKPRFDMDPADLLGTSWQLVSMDGGAPGTREAITLLFDASGAQVSGFAGCRSYRAAYQAEGDAIAFPFLEMLESDCPNPTALEIEGRYTDALSTATNWRLAEGRLELLTTRQGVLIFEPSQ